MKPSFPELSKDLSLKLQADYKRQAQYTRSFQVPYKSERQLQNDMSKGYLLTLCDYWNIAEPISTNRPEHLRGRIKFFVKQSIYHFISPFIRIFFDKQIQFNKTLVSYLSHIERLEKKIQDLEMRLQELTETPQDDRSSQDRSTSSVIYQSGRYRQRSHSDSKPAP